MLQVAGCSGFKFSSKHLMHIKLCSTVARLSSVKYPSQSEDSSLDMSRIYVYAYIYIYTHTSITFTVCLYTYIQIRTQIRDYMKIRAILFKENPTRDPTSRWASPTGGFTSGLFPTLSGSFEGDSLHCCPYDTKMATWTYIEPIWGLFGGWFVVKGLNVLYLFSFFSFFLGVWNMSWHFTRGCWLVTHYLICLSFSFVFLRRDFLF